MGYGHSHVTMYESQASCGILEIYNLSKDNKKVLYAIATRLYHPSRGAPAAFVLWSATSDDPCPLYDYIKSLKMDPAALFVTEYRDNPKTGNNMAVYLWAIPHEAFRAWYKTQKLAKLERDFKAAK